MKQLKFDHTFALSVAKGLQKTTLRVDDKGIKIGERLQLVDKTHSFKPDEWLILGEILIEMKQEFRVKDVPMNLFSADELTVLNKEELLRFLRRFYGESIHDETVLTYLTFQFFPYAKPLKFLASQATVDQSQALPEEVVLYADGGSRGNPGPSAAGFVIEDIHGQVYSSWNKYLGVTTNNQAEYHGLIAGLEWCVLHNVVKLQVRLDSMLVVNQMKGIFKVKNRDLWALYESAKELKAKFEQISFTHVPRELNTRADREVNKALDSISGKDVVQ